MFTRIKYIWTNEQMNICLSMICIYLPYKDKYRTNNSSTNPSIIYQLKNVVNTIKSVTTSFISLSIISDVNL